MKTRSWKTGGVACAESVIADIEETALPVHIRNADAMLVEIPYGAVCGDAGNQDTAGGPEHNMPLPRTCKVGSGR